MSEPTTSRPRPMDEFRSLLGSLVHVTIDETQPEPVMVTGILLAINDGGEVAIRHEDGFTTWCWPALKIEQVVE